MIAKGEDLKEAFGSDDHAVIARIILDKGELEVSGACVSPGRWERGKCVWIVATALAQPLIK